MQRFSRAPVRGLPRMVLCICSFCIAQTVLGEEIITAAGATFPYPLYKKWFAAYEQKTGTRIIYQPVGSGEGITKLLHKEVELGATDAFLSDDQLASIEDSVLHLPTCIGAVAVIYNLPGAPALRFTPDILSDIFLGTITTWTHKKIRQLNPDVTLPDTKIAVVHRSEGSGTSFIFTDYLSKINNEWNDKVGRGKIVQWPCGMGVAKNAGVAKMVRKISGAIGYVELSYAQSHNLSIVSLKNKSGEFVIPSSTSVRKAASVELPADARMLITDTPVEGGYPISGFTYFIFHRHQDDNAHTRKEATALADFLWWIVHEGQDRIVSEKYVPLPSSALPICERIIRSLRFHGSPLYDTPND